MVAPPPPLIHHCILNTTGGTRAREDALPPLSLPESMPIAVPSARAVLCLAALSTSFLAAHPVDFDVVVYGGTSGGVTAAVQVKRMGKTVALVSPTKHLGGLTTSGLGWTDLGKTEILGGLSREFYHRVYNHYYTATPTQHNAAWNLQTRSQYGNAGQGAPAFNAATETASVFEPKVALAVFNQLITEHEVPVFEARLDLDDGVVMEGGRITALKMEDGRHFRGKMFIDASYEGDLLPGAGVSFNVGREANATYGETVNGIQMGNATKNQLPNGIDPYVVKGDPSSGLLPGVNADAGGADGAADHRLQAYCFRMCLTSHAANRVKVTRPENYDEKDYELLFRAIEAGQKSLFFKFDAMPNFKTDSNNASGMSTDYIGMNYGPGWDWTTLDHDQRDALAARHRDWQLGLIWTLQNHPRVAAANNGNFIYPDIGLPADEFTDNGHWPWQLYVREARRMVSDYVMSQKNCTGAETVPDSVGLAAYAMDSHNVQRVVRNGMVKNEGDVQLALPNAYPVSYRSIVPKTGECPNLLVPWSLYASHMAFGSIRMEPVFMTLGQSAATAAVLSINDNLAVQNLPYEKLGAVLRADGQALTVGTPATGIIVDTEDATGVVITGAWTAASTTLGYNGTNYIHDGGEGRGQKSVLFTPVIPKTGNYRVSLRWNSHSNRATNIPVTITHSGGVANATVNQQTNGGTWFDLGVHPFTEGTNGSLLLSNTGVNGYVIADAAMWTPVGFLPTVQIFTPVPGAMRGDATPAAFVFTRDGETTAALEVFYRISGSADPSGLSPQPTGSIVIPAGKRDVRLPLTALSSTLPQGEKTFTVELSADAAYVSGASDAATIIVRDTPFEAWRFLHFSHEELTDPGVSGPFADPGGRGAVNLLRFFSGSDSGPSTLLLLRDDTVYFQLNRHRAAAGLAWEVEQSADLREWTPTPPDPARPHIPVEEQGEIQQLFFPVRHGGWAAGEKRFFRLRVAP